MPRGGSPEAYRCDEPPCIHVVTDPRRKIFKVFLEDFDGTVIPIPLRELEKACAMIREVRGEIRGLREASGEEVDFLARRYLEAEPEGE